jgi:hypothetical protein
MGPAYCSPACLTEAANPSTPPNPNSRWMPAPKESHRRRAPRKPRDITHLPVEETILMRDEAAAQPDAYRELERIATDRLDYQPGRILIQRTVPIVHVAKNDPDATPIKPAAPPSLTTP